MSGLGRALRILPSRGHRYDTASSATLQNRIEDDDEEISEPQASGLALTHHPEEQHEPQEHERPADE